MRRYCLVFAGLAAFATAAAEAPRGIIPGDERELTDSSPRLKPPVHLQAKASVFTRDKAQRALGSRVSVACVTRRGRGAALACRAIGAMLSGLNLDLANVDAPVSSRATQASVDALGASISSMHADVRTLVEAQGNGSLDVRIALYRCERYSRQLEPTRRALQRLLELQLPDAATARKVKSVIDDYRKADPEAQALQPVQLLQLARAWLRIGADKDAQALLVELGQRLPDHPGLDQACWQLAQRAREGSPDWRTRLELIVRHCPGSELAPKARFLLSQNA